MRYYYKQDKQDMKEIEALAFYITNYKNRGGGLQ